MKNRILVVEDSKINRNILVKILMDEYEVIQAVNGEDALEIIRQQYMDISAVILDLLMPKMDGRQLLSILSEEEKYANLPILIATGEHNNELESECLQLGAWDFITKPYNPIVLKLRLNNIIGRSKSYLLHRIQMLAQRDTLTNLYNRQFFMKETAKIIKEHEDITFVLVRMDIDQFKLFNSSFGSEAGDKLLKKMADCIRNKLKENKAKYKTYGRIESDVFCVCLPYEKESLERKLCEYAKEIQGFSSEYRLKVSFGLYVIDNPNLEIEKMYSNSVEAAQKCKYNLNKIYAYYVSEMGKREEKAQILTNEMETAIKKQQFKVYFQPKYSIETNSPCGAEALVRWIHSEWGIVSPGEFIPVFEQNGLIVQLDYYMWENVCIILRRWIDTGITIYPVSVNVSRISMYNPNIVDSFVELTDKYHIPRYLLNLEITESAYMSNPDLMKSTISKLREEGFVVLMDDFGSGFSSLNTLKDIDVDILKIDMKFLPTGNNNTKSEKILASITRMAGWLGMPVVVEGVETKEQKDFLESIGCIYVQGYYYAKPMPVEEYEKLIEENKQTILTCEEKATDLLSDFDAIWSSDSVSSTLLKSVSVPFAIFEYSKPDTIDILRMNQAYTKIFGSRNLERYLVSQEVYKFQTAVDDVVNSRHNEDCECLFIMADGTTRWYQIRLTYIGTVDKTSLVSATFSDVTTERILEKEVNVVFSAIRERYTHRGSLLVVDDQEISRDIVNELFKDEYDILMAEDGIVGLDLLRENADTIAAILLDMIMPNMNGQEFLSYKNMIPEAADIPVIVISSEDSAAIQMNMLESGVNDYITKPFVPAVMKRRLKNVLEYNSRFRTLVQEYRNLNNYSKLGRKGCASLGYSIDEIHEMMAFMGQVFDLVRLVDPKNTAVVTVQPNGTIRKDPYSCFSVWGKSVRCNNCSSMCALNGSCALNKFELLKNDVFYVVSQPVSIIIEEGIVEELVLEIASKISNREEVPAKESDNICQLIESNHTMIYTDPITEAFNRRFLEELQFLHYGQNSLAKKVVIVMLDLYKFRQINDLFGHQAGDRVLKEVVKTLKSQIRQTDSVIRYGGDEFIVAMTNCEKGNIEPSIERFRKAIAGVKYGPKDTISLDADFGYAYVEEFVFNETNLSDMLLEAERCMQEAKRLRIETKV